MKTKTPTIIYDGDCELCNSAVRFLKMKGKKDPFTFVPSSDSSVPSILEEFKMERETTGKTVILIDKDQVYTKSAAIIKSVQMRGKLWRLAGILFIVPAFLRDLIYDIIARKRK